MTRLPCHLCGGRVSPELAETQGERPTCERCLFPFARVLVESECGGRPETRPPTFGELHQDEEPVPVVVIPSWVHELHEKIHGGQVPQAERMTDVPPPVTDEVTGEEPKFRIEVDETPRGIRFASYWPDDDSGFLIRRVAWVTLTREQASELVEDVLELLDE